MFNIEDVKPSNINPIPVLVVEDDDEDKMLMQHVFDRVFALGRIHFVSDGQEALDYLSGAGSYSESVPVSPKLILLDLNMPVVSGRVLLQKIKANPSLCHIPVVIYSTSDSRDEVTWCYANGAAGYIVKPASIQAMETALMTLGVYWGDLVKLP